jgi:hypothetical protein
VTILADEYPIGSRSAISLYRYARHIDMLDFPRTAHRLESRRSYLVTPARTSRSGPAFTGFGLALILLSIFPGPCQGQSRETGPELVEKFKATGVFWKQLEIAKNIVRTRDVTVLPQLEPWLSLEDRHLRGNAAFIFAALGDRRGFDIIIAILNDRSDRGEGQGIPGGTWNRQAQIRSDRYYAVHLLGELRDPAAVPVLTELMQDNDVNYKVAWALGEIGGNAAVQGLIQALTNDSPDVRAIAIQSLGKLNARETLPQLRSMLKDNERCHFDKLASVAETASAVITKLEQP